MKSKIFSLFILLLSFCSFQNIYGQDCVWAKSAGGSNTDNSNSVATDATGNVYVTGYYYSQTITFGTTTLNNTDTIGHSDMFLVKYNTSGNVVWARSIGGSGDDKSFTVTTCANGYIYITGSFSSPTITFGTTTLTNTGPSYTMDIFLVKYDSTGSVVWAKSAGGVLDDNATSVTTDVSGNNYITGYFRSPTITFGTTLFTNSDTGIYNTSDIFVVKYDYTGSVVWAKCAGGNNSDFSKSITTNASGEIYITGWFQSPIITFGTTTLTDTGIGSGLTHIFLAKYNDAGSVVWAKGAGGNLVDLSNSVATDTAGNIYVTGYFKSTTITFGTTMLTNIDTNNTADIFLVKYDNSGSVVWARRAGGSSDDGANSVSTDASGNVYIGGFFCSPNITFGDTTFTKIGTGYSENVFFVKYNTTGSVEYANIAGGFSYGDVASVTTDTSGNAYITGNYNSPTIIFGTTTLTNICDNDGHYDIFLAKYSFTLSVPTILNETNNLKLYPNPATNEITVSIAQQGISAIIITDMVGREVVKQQVNQLQNVQTITISLHDLVNGMYILRTVGNEGRESTLFEVRK